MVSLPSQNLEIKWKKLVQRIIYKLFVDITYTLYNKIRHPTRYDLTFITSQIYITNVRQIRGTVKQSTVPQLLQMEAEKPLLLISSCNSILT